jgi:hypothetical protein
VWHSTVTFLAGLFASFMGLLFGFRPNSTVRRITNNSRGWWF